MTYIVNFSPLLTGCRNATCMTASEGQTFITNTDGVADKETQPMAFANKEGCLWVAWQRKYAG